VRDGGTMTVALADDPDMLDPTLAQTLVGRMVFMSMCEKLYDHRPEAERRATVGGEPADHLAGRAQRRDQAPPGVRSNDDTPLDAEAVKRSLDRHRTLEGSQLKSELLAVTRVDVVDPATVRIRLSQPFAPLAAVLADRSGMVMSPSGSTSSAPTWAVQNHRTSGTTASEERRRQPHAFPAGYLVARGRARANARLPPCSRCVHRRCTGRPRRSRLTCHLVCEVYGRRVVELRGFEPLTPCMPCSFGLLPHPRSGRRSPAQRPASSDRD
jgi:hypothetical protein